jgi:spore germination protein GerM
MKQALAVLLLLGSLAACASDASTTTAPPPGAEQPGAPSAPPESTPSNEGTTIPAASSDEATTTVELWYSVATTSSIGEGLVAVYRDIHSTPGIGAATLRAWLDGPTSGEMAAGIHASIPEGTELLGLHIENGTAIVDLSSDFERTSMGTFGESFLLEELAWTITQFPTVDRVLLKIDGEFKDHYMGHGFIIDETRPLERNRRDPVAPILVSGPRFGARFASGDAVEGTANVFEATVSIRLLDDDGNKLFEGFTTATCGTGCRGDYWKRIRFDIDHQQPGTIEVFEVSAEDGSETNKITVPVMLVP